MQVLGDQLNNRPIIGILAQELSDYMSNKYPGNHTSYIAASYIKYVEGGGARAVPIMINQTESYYENLMNSINGVIFPGGAANFNTANGYADAGKILYNLALKKNQAGDYFPVWGTCLGFELLSYFAAEQVNILTSCEAENVAMPLDFISGFNTTRLFKDAPHHIWDIMESQNVTANFHKFCLTQGNFTLAGLNRDWQIISVNEDKNGMEFISSFEHKLYPFYGVQFHPEKNAYEWNTMHHTPHSFYGILVGQYFANFFVNEARKSNHQFPTKQAEEEALIYNFNPTYTGLNHSSFEQIYFF